MMPSAFARSTLTRWTLAVAVALTAALYWPGLYGSYLFDDYPNIVENPGVQPHDASLPTLVRAALSSPSSEFKRPLASLSFAANYLASGLDPYWMKLTNLAVHLLNGLLVFLLARLLLQSARKVGRTSTSSQPPDSLDMQQDSLVAALVAAAWMLLPVNLTAVLYVVQRMESMANIFVLLGLIGYCTGRRRMLDRAQDNNLATVAMNPGGTTAATKGNGGFLLCAASITVPAAIGILAKETAVLLPLYAFLIEWALFNFRTAAGAVSRRIVVLYVVVLLVPAATGLAWIIPGIMKPENWAIRDFNLHTRLLSEARIVIEYIRWTLCPTPHALSFYHDDFRISTGVLKPWTTLASIAALLALGVLALWIRARRPLVALGIALFLGCQSLTATIIPLELIYEHRNYFASFGLLLAVLPLLAVPRSSLFSLPRRVLLAGLLVCWATLTGLTAYAWGNPLRLADDLAARAPESPRAQYELGRTYILYSHYAPDSPFTRLAYAPLEKAASLPDASILPEQALLFLNARMNLPLKDAWWNSLTSKLAARKPTIQDESALGALTQCAREGRCKLPHKRMIEAYMAALAHPDPSARLLAAYGDYAWNVLDDHDLGERVTLDAVKASPKEPAYRITLIRMLSAQGRVAEARVALEQLKALNVGGSLNDALTELEELPGVQ